MFYLALILFSVCAWWAPWWAIAPVALVVGVLMENDGKTIFKSALAAGLAWAATAFLLDGRSLGLVSRRLAGLFSLPSIYFVYILTGLMGFITAFLFIKAGSTIGPWRRSGSRDQAS
jgi:hypothetical protein